MPIPLFTNNAATALAVAITPTDTVLQITAGTGSEFPSPTGGNYFMLTLVQINNPEVSEIVKCINRTGDYLTIERGQENTQPQIFNISDNVQLRITAQSLNLFAQGGGGSGGGAATQVVEFTATQGQSVFTIPFSYVPDNYNLAVFVNGSKQIIDVNYSESSSTSITFFTGLNVGDLVEVVYNLPIAAGQIDASNILYDQGGVGAVESTVQKKLEESVSVKDFGAVGDGVTDDYNAIQTAIKYGFANDVNITFPSGTYAISQTIIIPQFFNYLYQGIEINGNFCFIKMLADVPAFTSGYYNSGVLVTNFGTVEDSYYSSGIRLKNFNIISSLSSLQSGCIKIQDWHQGSEIQNISSSAYDTMLYLVDCYYTQVDSVQSSGGKGSFGGARMLFYSNNNLMKVSNCVVAGAGIGYQFQGAVDAFQFTNNSVEGCDIGIQTLGAVYDLIIQNSYFESTTLSMDFQSYVQVEITDNYFNLGNDAAKRLIKYLPSPSNNILFDENNYVVNIATTFEQQLFYAKDTVYSAGITIKQYQGGSGLLSSIIKDNTYLTPNADWQQKILIRGTRANVVNDLAAGNYSGRMSGGYSTSAGFDDISSGTTLALSTKIIPSATQRIYVNIRINLSGTGFIYVAGEFIGNKFYCFDTSGITVPASGNTYLTLTTVGGYIQINNTMTTAIATQTVGEIRLI